MVVLIKDRSTARQTQKFPKDLPEAIREETRFINGVLKMVEGKESTFLLTIAKEHILAKLEFIDARLAELGSEKEKLGKGLLRGIHKRVSIPIIEKLEGALAADRKRTEKLLKKVDEKIASAQKAGEQEGKASEWPERAEKEEIPPRIRERMERSV